MSITRKITSPDDLTDAEVLQVMESYRANMEVPSNRGIFGIADAVICAIGAVGVRLNDQKAFEKAVSERHAAIVSKRG